MGFNYNKWEKIVYLLLFVLFICLIYLVYDLIDINLKLEKLKE